ncbi:MAG: hypothetical protein WC717_04600, partial [Candidatus Micrarchaeia archaeon]
MASQTTMDIAKTYLEKHLASPEIFGLGPYLERQGSDWMICHSSEDHNLDSLTIKLSSGAPIECFSIAKTLCNDIKITHPELKPKIMTCLDKGIHNWVEITCPQTGDQVQIDCTPWYACLNPGHENGEEIAGNARSISFNNISGPPFAIKRNGQGFITIYLTGFTPKFAGHGAGAPEYSFTLMAVHETAFS